MQGKVVECPICGTKMTIPPGYEKMAARCRACNTVLNQGPQLASAMAGIGSMAPPVAAAQAAPQSKADFIRCQLKSAVLGSFLWGSAGAIAGGLVIALISMAITQGAGQMQMRAAAFGGAEFGAVAGFLLGSVWGMVSGFDMSFAAGAGIAALFGLVLSVSHHLVETTLIAPPDEPIYLTGIVGLSAGAFVGFVSVWFKEYRENAD